MLEVHGDLATIVLAERLRCQGKSGSIEGARGRVVLRVQCAADIEVWIADIGHWTSCRWLG